MSVNDARRFIHSIPEDNGLRNILNRCESSESIDEILGKNGFKFNPDEFIEAWSCEVPNSPTKECHEQFNDLRMWWKLLNRF